MLALCARAFLFYSKRVLYVPKKGRVYVDGDTGTIYQERPNDFFAPNRNYTIRLVNEWEFSKQYRFPRIAIKALSFLNFYKTNDPRIVN